MKGNRDRIKRLLNLWLEEEDDEGVMIELRKELERRGYIKREEVILREREIEEGKRGRTRLEELLKEIMSGRLEGRRINVDHASESSSSELFIEVGPGSYQEDVYVAPNHLPGELVSFGDWHRRDEARFSGLGVSPEMFYVDSSVDLYAAAYTALEKRSEEMRGEKDRTELRNGLGKLDLSWITSSIDSSSSEEEIEDRDSVLEETSEMDSCVEKLCEGGEENRVQMGGNRWCDSSVSYGVDGWAVGKDKEEMCIG